MSACLLSLSVMSLLLPVRILSCVQTGNGSVLMIMKTAFHASWSNSQIADQYTLKVSRGTSVVSIGNYFADKLVSFMTIGPAACVHPVHHLSAQIPFLPLRQHPAADYRRGISSGYPG